MSKMPERGTRLTPAEIKYLRAVRYGLESKEIARRHGVSRSTVTSMLTCAYRRLGATNGVTAVLTAIEKGYFH